MTRIDAKTMESLVALLSSVMERLRPDAVRRARHDDCIVGDAFVCGSDGDGNSVGLTEAQELALRRRLSELGI